MGRTTWTDLDGMKKGEWTSEEDRKLAVYINEYGLGDWRSLPKRAVSWKSSLQQVVDFSTTEAEYIARIEAVKEGIWLRGLLEDFGFKQDSACIWCDSQSALCLAKNNVFHERTKHMAMKYNFIRDVIASKEVEVQKIHTSENPADMLTKVIIVGKFNEALEFLKVLKN